MVDPLAALQSAEDTRLRVAWFECKTAVYGEEETMVWRDFASVFTSRREGKKDGANFVPARFHPEPGRRRVRRLKATLAARTAIALDVEANKKTGEAPPSLQLAVNRVRALGLACIGYTSHNHRPGDTRYRLVLPLSAEIAHELPAPEVMADVLGLAGVLDRSKLGAYSLFYLPSSPFEQLHQHETISPPEHRSTLPPSAHERRACLTHGRQSGNASPPHTPPLRHAVRRRLRPAMIPMTA